MSLVIASTVATFAVSREGAIHREWQGLPVAQQGDLDSLRQRRDAIEGMLKEHTFWAGVFSATEERDELVVAIHNEERLVARAEEQAELQRRRQQEEAEASRVRALQFVERGDYDRAIEQLERALTAAQPEWEHTAQVKVDLAALQKWKSEHGTELGAGRAPLSGAPR
ncbi:MAG: hypothetical protein R3F49_03740 [Planctomycetota bacterium]